jgi:hypothetical protein
MEASELKIGNLIYKCYPEGNEVVEVKNISENFVNSLGISSIKPIPLTEEWLLKFGFEKNENGLFKLFNESEVPILLNEDLNGWTCDGINFSVNGTQYIHQLQNLYFALTGEELTIKE